VFCEQGGNKKGEIELIKHILLSVERKNTFYIAKIEKLFLNFIRGN